MILTDADGAVLATKLEDTYYGMRFVLRNQRTGEVRGFVRPPEMGPGQRERAFTHPRWGRLVCKLID